MKKILQTTILLFTINCLSQPGALDTTFGTGGKVQTAIADMAKAYAVVIQPDGKILVAGQAWSFIGTGGDFACVRYNSNGTLDTTFGTGGIVTTNVMGATNSIDMASCMALQSDGRIILAGNSYNAVTPKAAMIRYNSNGTIDNTFGDNGVVLTEFEPLKSSYINAIKIDQTTGKIVVGGAIDTEVYISKPVVARYSSNGTLDLTFNGSGIKTLWIESTDNQYTTKVEDLVLMPSGKIGAVGYRNMPANDNMSDHWACRINADGTMDTTFSTDGVAHYNGLANGNDKSFSMLLKPDNTFVVGGSSDLSEQDYAFSLYEITPNGTLGALHQAVSFDTTHQSMAYGLALDSSGKYILLGSTGQFNINRSFALTAINPDYTVDTPFGTNGKVTTTFGTNTLNEAFAVAVQSDNKIVAVGYAGNEFAIARYNGASALKVNEFAANDIIKIYPNPASDYLKINLTNDSFAEFQILDMNGRTVSVGFVSKKENEIIVNQLAKGMYIFKIGSLNFYQKFIKE